MTDFQQPPPVNPYDSPETVRPGMSSGAKVFLGLGIGCGVLLLLCCGFFGVAAYFFGRSFNIDEDPATVRRVADSIVTIDVPETLEPRFSFDWTLPVVNRKMMSMAMYADEEENSDLILFQISEDLGNRDAMKMQLQESLRDAGRGQWEEVNLDESETFETEINGDSAEFTVGKGKKKGSGREVWQAIGAFEGNGGPAMLFMQLGAEDFSNEQVMDVLKSMR